MKRRGAGDLVYSTGKGRMCPNCRRPVKNCACRKSPRVPQGDGIVRVRREVKGRGGKTVTTISGVPLPEDALKDLAGELKRACGSGGSCKSGVIEIQGDHRATLTEQLQTRGYNVKLAGG
ncbi:MAG: translation initiation factor Sui1 [bacterium]|nr:translation initiation factor Sui1 [bacterium]